MRTVHDWELESISLFRELLYVQEGGGGEELFRTDLR